MKAALAPIKARPVNSVVTLCENAARSDETANAKSAICMTRRRPQRSESPPPASRRPANGSEYPSTIHWRAEFDAWRSREIVGSATLTMVLSTTTKKTAMHRTNSTNHRRSLAIVGTNPPRLTSFCTAGPHQFGQTERLRPYLTHRVSGLHPAIRISLRMHARKHRVLETLG